MLITNDDGVRAPGIRALAEAVRELDVDVVVAAPAEEASGMGAALTAVVEDGRILFETTPVGFGVAASPAYIVVLAGLGAFGPPPDVVLSGINRGANIGRGLLHSGTVGAALTAASQGARAMAVSLDVLGAGDPESGGAAVRVTGDADLHWRTAADLAAGLLGPLAAAPPGTVLNLNVPDRPDVPALRRASLAESGQVRMAVAERGTGFVRLTLERAGDAVAGSDVALLEAGFATVTELQSVTEAPSPAVPVQRISR